MATYQDQSQWSEFLEAFSRRNHFRRARFERFDRRDVEEEDQEAHLDKIAVEFDGDDAPRIIITRVDTSKTEPRTIVTTIPDVKWLTPRFTPENSDESLEMENSQHVLVILRLEAVASSAA